MKKLFACALIFTMCMAGFAACGSETNANPTATPTAEPTATTEPTQAPAVDTVSDLVNAKNYLFTMYKDQTEATPVDYTVVGVVNIGGVMFNIDWTVDQDSVKIIPGDNKMVTIDIDDQNPEEVIYVLTATLKDAAGNTESCSFTRRVPAAIIIEDGMSYADIVDAAYALEDGLTMDGTFRLYGTITKIDTAWSDTYNNITVTITVAGKEDKPIMCYRLAGEGAKNLAVGDAITVEGSFKNYKGTIEFDQGCVLVGYGEHKDYTALLDAAYTLEDGLSMNEPCTMSGVITKIDTPWDAGYKNITVTMIVNGVEDKPIMCYRLQGEGADALAIGDYITVTGTIKNYKGTIEFDAKCNLDNVVKGTGEAPAETPAPTEAPAEEPKAVDPTGMTAAQILDAAYALADGEAFAAPCTLTGVITSIKDAYSEKYGNISVIIEVEGNTEKPMLCYRMVGDGIADLAAGDTVTVTGTIKNYKGTIEFDTKCTLDAVVKAEAPVETPAPTEAPVEEPKAVDPTGMTAAQILDAAYALADGEAFAAPCTLTGVITSIKDAYSEKYGNISVIIEVEGNTEKPMLCYRMVGDGIADLAAGDTVTVTGTIKNYKGTIEFDTKCTLDAVVKAEAPAAVAALEGTYWYSEEAWPSNTICFVDNAYHNCAYVSFDKGNMFVEGIPTTVNGIDTSSSTAEVGSTVYTLQADGTLLSGTGEEAVCWTPITDSAMIESINFRLGLVKEEVYKTTPLEGTAWIGFHSISRREERARLLYFKDGEVLDVSVNMTDGVPTNIRYMDRIPNVDTSVGKIDTRSEEPGEWGGVVYALIGDALSYRVFDVVEADYGKFTPATDEFRDQTLALVPAYEAQYE